MTSIRSCAMSGLVMASLLLAPTPSSAQPTGKGSTADSLTTIVRGAAAFFAILALVDAVSEGGRHRALAGRRQAGKHHVQHAIVVRRSAARAS